MLTIKCPTCQNELSCDDSCRGCIVECSICQSEIEIMQNGMPRPAGAAAPSMMPAPAPVPAPAPDSYTPYSQPSRERSSGSGSGLATAAIVLSCIAIVASAVIGFFLWKCYVYVPDFKFSSDPEETAKYIFERIELRGAEKGCIQKAFVLGQSKKEALENFEMDTEEKGDYVLVLWETKFRKEKWYGHYWLKENKNGVYVYTGHPKYDEKYEKMSDSEKEWLTKMDEKIRKHEKDNKDFDWDIKIK